MLETIQNRLNRVVSQYGGIPVLAVIVVISVLTCIPRAGRLAPAHGDVPAYLAAAYHLQHERVFSQAPTSVPTLPSLGREPAYPLLLAVLMATDPAFREFTPSCLTADTACPTRTYRAASLANLALIQLTGIVLFFLGRRICGTAVGGLVTAGYLLLNLHWQKGWADPMSDRLAVFLLAVAMLALAWAWQTSRPVRFALAGAAFAALTLTKALFLPFCVAAWAVALAVTLRHADNRRRAIITLCVTATTYGLLVGGWAWRNDAVSGQFRLTDARSGIALSTREVFDRMSPAQYAASFIYWTRGFGPGLARHVFGHAIVDPFDLEQPGGFYDRGQNTYAARVSAAMGEGNLTYWQATARVDGEIVAAIRTHWQGYLLSMPSLIYRGLWIDEFIVLGLPCLLYVLMVAVRRRNTLLLLLLGTGVYNLIFYAVVSLNVPRYQMTAIPAIALAVGFTASRVRASRQ